MDWKTAEGQVVELKYELAEALAEVTRTNQQLREHDFKINELTASLRTLTAQVGAMRSLLERVRTAEDPKEYLSNLKAVLGSSDAGLSLLQVVEAAQAFMAQSFLDHDQDQRRISIIRGSGYAELAAAIAALQREPGWEKIGA